MSSIGSFPRDFLPPENRPPSHKKREGEASREEVKRIRAEEPAAEKVRRSARLARTTPQASQKPSLSKVTKVVSSQGKGAKRQVEEAELKTPPPKRQPLALSHLQTLIDLAADRRQMSSDYDQAQSKLIEIISNFEYTDEQFTTTSEIHKKLPLLGNDQKIQEAIDDYQEKYISSFGSFDRLLEFTQRFGPTIRNLNLDKAKVSDPVKVKELIKYCPNLTHLSLASWTPTKEVIESISRLSFLQQLDLSWCQELSDSDLERLSSLTSLQQLNLKACHKLTDAGLEYIAKLPLQQLNLSRTSLTPNCFKYLSRLHKLKQLDLSDCPYLERNATLTAFLVSSFKSGLQIKGLDETFPKLSQETFNLASQRLGGINKTQFLKKLGDEQTDETRIELSRMFGALSDTVMNTDELFAEFKQCFRSETPEWINRITEQICESLGQKWGIQATVQIGDDLLDVEGAYEAISHMQLASSVASYLPILLGKKTPQLQNYLKTTNR